ncbi:hypothetical protein FW774_14100 [Pedobacter sp. BS3]|uniref:hypothetical protein n=1 Tax=Pedobacter sp. BS3 TaxID=2567937 RepID=UPI0011EEAD94|nr:hypothetical protein [Pedobacter sp. BS3]TZF82633.1 hypothetical protein FW774_14100 [Pedobacter sp. BS3]
MKLLIVTSIKECRDKVADIFKETDIQVFSVSEIAGFKEGSPVSLTHNWFGSSGDSYDSIMLFSFTEKEKAEKALELIIAYNQSADTGFPVRGFILPVERSGY